MPKCFENLSCLSSVRLLLPLAGLFRGSLEFLSLGPENVRDNITEVLQILETLFQRGRSGRCVYMLVSAGYKK